MINKRIYWAALLALTLLFSGCRTSGRPNAEQPSNQSGPLASAPLPAATIAPLTTAATPGAAQPDPSAPGSIPQTNAGLDQSGAACLVGTWEVADLSHAMAGALAQTGASLSLDQLQGSARYEFGADGGMQIRYDSLSAALSGQVGGQQVNVLQSLNGSGTARYSIDAASGELVFSEFGGDGIHSRLEVNGQVLAEGSISIWQAIVGQLGGSVGQSAADALNQTRAAAFCSGDSLTIRALAPIASPDVYLRRVQ